MAQVSCSTATRLTLSIDLRGGRRADALVQVAQYKVFLGMVAPGNGFASTLGFELGVGKIRAFAGKASANMIAKRTGDFAWVFWVVVFHELVPQPHDEVFYWLTNVVNRNFHGVNDSARGELLKERSKKFELKKALT
ncbi:hypothetical protein PMIN01_10989 [Paraphaeosphaeria minitans]|uniref:Uncharacterized protein n=1 Tax=Paraphaeosphaeria minitans TaxID=565426 RepID=A0A9P6G8F0_9PLEO|nr:hypothetical protein PMIN01_10989 [Paraphaeosphaeria minitans]